MQVIYNIPTAWLTTLPFTYIINDILEVGLLFAILLHGSALVSGDKTDLKARLKINWKLMSVVCLISLLMVLYRVIMRFVWFCYSSSFLKKQILINILILALQFIMPPVGVEQASGQSSLFSLKTRFISPDSCKFMCKYCESA